MCVRSMMHAGMHISMLKSTVCIYVYNCIRIFIWKYISVCENVSEFVSVCVCLRPRTVSFCVCAHHFACVYHFAFASYCTVDAAWNKTEFQNLARSWVLGSRFSNSGLERPLGFVPSQTQENDVTM